MFAKYIARCLAYECSVNVSIFHEYLLNAYAVPGTIPILMKFI